MNLLSQFSKKQTRSFALSLVCCLSLSVLCIPVIDAQSKTNIRPSADHLFVKKGQSAVTVATGIPYVGIAELAYGISDRFTVGVLAGTTPRVPGFGVRFRNILYSNERNKRIYLRTPLLYYPQTKGLGGEPWILTWPSINYEIHSKSGIRWSYGLGMVAAACVNDLLDIAGIKKHLHDTPTAESAVNHHIHSDESHSAHSHLTSEAGQSDSRSGRGHPEGFMGGIWNTIQGGMTTPISSNWTFQAELGLVMKGVTIDTKDWVGGPPVILTLGMTHVF